MLWNSHPIKKRKIILKYFGSNTQNQSLPTLRDIMSYHQNNTALSEINSSDQTTGGSIYSHPSDNNFQRSNKVSSMSQYSNPINKEELEFYLCGFTNLEDLNSEIKRIRDLMVVVESSKFKTENSTEEIKTKIGGFTQLFKALLAKKELMLRSTIQDK